MYTFAGIIAVSLTYRKMSFEFCDSVKFSKYVEKEYYNFKSYSVKVQ